MGQDVSNRAKVTILRETPTNETTKMSKIAHLFAHLKSQIAIEIYSIQSKTGCKMWKTILFFNESVSRYPSLDCGPHPLESGSRLSCLLSQSAFHSLPFGLPLNAWSVFISHFIRFVRSHWQRVVVTSKSRRKEVSLVSKARRSFQDMLAREPSSNSSATSFEVMKR